MTQLKFLILLLAFPDFSENLQNDNSLFHIGKIYTNNELQEIVSKYNETYLHAAVVNILIPRVVGTPGHCRVKHFITDSLENLGWAVELDTFNAKTPTHGTLEFSNIIAKLNPDAERYLTLACHYDSKYFKNNPNFVGATDSAVPCAIMLEIAHAFREEFKRAQPQDPSIMLIFFDGEEAFHQWSAVDSIYGSRNLAHRWSRSSFQKGGETVSELSRIDMLVLLDLMGARDPTFYNYFQNTARWHTHLASLEKKLKSLSLIPSDVPQHFLEKSTYGGIEDDHIPFLKKDVPVLHLIPYPFPDVWHTPKDDYDVLDFPTIRTISVIMQTFVASYLNL